MLAAYLQSPWQVQALAIFAASRQIEYRVNVRSIELSRTRFQFPNDPPQDSFADRKVLLCDLCALCALCVKFRSRLKAKQLRNRDLRTTVSPLDEFPDTTINQSLKERFVLPSQFRKRRQMFHHRSLKLLLQDGHQFLPNSRPHSRRIPIRGILPPRLFL